MKLIIEFQTCFYFISDLAVGAPYEDGESGAVYIYMGFEYGIRTKYSQKLKPLNSALSSIRHSQYFGFSLSRGVDIDNNGFYDLAVGEPNTPKVYVFKSYPSIDIITEIYTDPGEIPISIDEATLFICVKYASYQFLNFSVPTNFTINIKTSNNQASFLSGITKRDDLKINLTMVSHCEEYTLQIVANESDLNHPIQVQLSYDLIRIPDPNAFCNDCAVLNPYVDHFAIETIPFVTGCNSSLICTPDLKIYAEAVDFDRKG